MPRLSTKICHPHICSPGRLAHWLAGSIAAALFFATSMPAQAEVFQWDFGGGMSRFSSVSPFFPGDPQGTPGASSLGISANLSAAISLSNAHAPTRFYLGVQHRYTSASHAGGNAVLQSLYPILRIQTGDVFVTLGGTVFNFGKANGGLTSFDRLPSGTVSFLAEGGYLYPITPEVGFGFTLATRFALSAGAFNAKPLLECGALFRFYYGKGGGGSSIVRQSSDSYDGFRYPMGWQR